MATSRIPGLARHATPLLLVFICTACVEHVRVPLAVPLTPVGGARPAGPQGLHATFHFGSGLRGQEQERVRLIGGGLGVAVGDAIELELASTSPTEPLYGSSGGEHRAASTTTLRGKLRMTDFWSGGAAMALHAAYSWASRSAGDAQDEEMSALDLAVPVEFYMAGAPQTPHRLGVYAGPRVVFQRFRDRIGQDRSAGSAVGALVGLAGRWRFLAVSGEFDIMRTAELAYRGRSYGGGWIVLPVVGARLILPVGG